jgi:hypothetical protein
MNFEFFRRIYQPKAEADSDFFFNLSNLQIPPTGFCIAQLLFFAFDTWNKII